MIYVILLQILTPFDLQKELQDDKHTDPRIDLFNFGLQG